MASQALYRKWRSRTFEDIVAQDHVTHTLANALHSGRIAHAYLFTGPRGTGKTSTARLLAKAANCLGPEDGPRPCNQCPICQAVDEGRLIDLIEIDAASNRGIDEIRDLREKVNFRPNEARYKVYVIDEVHMLTNEAFNALLKTLEEPPGHVIFVLATTEPHKIPATVLSRCQRFDFRRIPAADIVGRLRYIAEQEGILVKDDALAFIARQATGSLRDAISLLDQLVAYGEETVSVEQVQQILGLVPPADRPETPRLPHPRGHRWRLDRHFGGDGRRCGCVSTQPGNSRVPARNAPGQDVRRCGPRQPVRQRARRRSQAGGVGRPLSFDWLDESVQPGQSRDAAWGPSATAPGIGTRECIRRATTPT